MNQTQPTRSQPKSYLKLLLIILGVVIVGSGLYYYFGVYKATKGSSSISLTSPTPTKSTVVSPSASSGSAKTATPSEGQTATPQTSPSTSTATPQPPSGWKYDTYGLTDQSGHQNNMAKYVVLIKNEWNRGGGNNSSLHGIVGYGEVINSLSAKCGPADGDELCPFTITISTGTPSDPNQFATANNSGMVTLTFNGLSESDQKIIRDSFKITN